MREIHTDVPEERLRARTQCRDRIDLLRGRLGLLEGKEKVMMTMYLENGNSFRQIARLLGVSEASISRKIRALTTRLVDNDYVACLRTRGKLTSDQMQIAKDYFLMGLSVSKIAARRHTSCYRVRQTIRKTRMLARGASSGGNSK